MNYCDNCATVHDSTVCPYCHGTTTTSPPIAKKANPRIDELITSYYEQGCFLYITDLYELVRLLIEDRGA